MPRKKVVVVSHSRAHIHTPTSLSDRIADRITGFVGSWLFVGIHAVWFIGWILVRLEPFPFGLLTLMVSLEAIFLSTFVMMSQNRSGVKDHIRDDHEAKEVDELFKINTQQVLILNQQTEILNLLRTHSIPPDSTLTESTTMVIPVASRPRATRNPPVSAITQPMKAVRP